MTETNATLLTRLKAGEDVRAELISSNLGLVRTIVGSFVRSMPNVYYLDQDLVSEGHIALVEAVDALKGRPHDENVTRYIARVINNRLSKFIREETSLVPHRTQLDYETESERVDAPTVKTVGLIVRLKETPEPTELLDAIYAACQSDNDRVIVDLRRKGYKDEYIANVLNLSFQRIFQLRTAIEERYDSANLS